MFIEEQLQYWIDYDGTGDEYRKTHDLDCILTNGNLYADTLFSLWLPLRYVLDYCDTEIWNEKLKYEREQLRPKRRILKDDTDFLYELKNNICKFIPDKNILKKYETLCQYGRTRANVIILPYRKWNTLRGRAPYWDYMPHFLFDLLNTNDSVFINAVTAWIKTEHLNIMFEGVIDAKNILDLAATGNVCTHKNVDVGALLDNYIDILQVRSELL